MEKKPSRKGVSAEEKRTRMLNIFHETCEVYQLKDLEKIGPKKGINAQSVKDVVQSLVDDDLVITDKIGSSNYYWSFPSAATQAIRNEIDNLQKMLRIEEANMHQLEKEMEKEQEDREPSDDRDTLLAKLQETLNIQKELEQELKQYTDSDSANFELKEKANQVAKEAVNRWTENVWAIQSYCVNKFGMDQQQFNQNFNISDDFDTIV
ncbi:meiotic nuclear division protein 1 [Halteromyces radiatus]|uniref:meiotic nuclear division protein 1 n=1 Tax=Halteromyces radiatus TaxID=101107 RepID=UPI00221E39FE|nr:meiotic nuclear division protein 1 [Halteromyces radiatus]KAI8099773.1 meiotic nuclear division protein 1 [Halteromyces radiatus]